MFITKITDIETPMLTHAAGKTLVAGIVGIGSFGTFAASVSEALCLKGF